MSLIELFLIAVGLSMDAFAVAVCKGLAMPKMSWKGAAIVGLYFGGFQALMPFLGYLLGAGFKDAISAYDHWVAFILLALIGGNMIRESREDEEESLDASLSFRSMVLLAIATSIDALAVGVSMAFMNVPVLLSAVVIGVVAFVLSVVGGLAGRRLGALFQRRAELVGGLVLVGIGIKILVEHTMGG